MPGAAPVQMMYPSAPAQIQWVQNSHYRGYNSVPVTTSPPVPPQYSLPVPPPSLLPSQYPAQTMRGPVAESYTMTRPVAQSHTAAQNLSYISQERLQQDVGLLNSVTWQQQQQGFNEQQYRPPPAFQLMKEQASKVHSSPPSVMSHPFSNNPQWNQMNGDSQRPVNGGYGSVPVSIHFEERSSQNRVNGYSHNPISPQQKPSLNQASEYFPPMPVSSQQQRYETDQLNGQMHVPDSPSFDQRSPTFQVPGYIPKHISPQQNSHPYQMNGQFQMLATPQQNSQLSRVGGDVRVPLKPQPQDSQCSQGNGHVRIPVMPQQDSQYSKHNGHAQILVTPHQNVQPNQVSRHFQLPVMPQGDEPKSPLNGMYEPVTPTKEDIRHPFEQTIASQQQGSSLNPQCSPELVDTDDPFGVFAMGMWEKLTAENEAKIKRIYNKQTTACKQLFDSNSEFGAESYQNPPVHGHVNIEEPEEEEDLALAMAVSDKPRVVKHPAERVPYVTNRGYLTTADSVSLPGVSPTRAPPPLLPIANMISEGDYSDAVNVDTSSQQVSVSQTDIAMRWSRIEKYLDHIKNYIVFIKFHKNSQGCDCQVDEVSLLNTTYREQFREWHGNCFGSKEAQVTVDEASKKARSNKFLVGWERIISAYWSRLQETVNKVNRCKAKRAADMNGKPGQKRKADPLSQLSTQNGIGRPKRSVTGEGIAIDRDTCVVIKDSLVNNNVINNHSTQSASQFNISNNSLAAIVEDVNMNSITQSVGVSSNSSESDLEGRGRELVETGPVYGVKLEISRLLENGGPNGRVDRTRLKALADRSGLSFKTVQNLYFAEMVSSRQYN